VSGVISVFSLNACVVTWPMASDDHEFEEKAADIIGILASFLAAVLLCPEMSWI
jgi:hypothetical protein